ncbi:MAG: RNA polymerase sigma-70 factor [Candidatus Pedobacter colombiensis]|uniref:RNA polymerase sigma-70 factor n=1 Tax=Candidatus Pedobacter colombiensis TaxID=3121371 RepID=A0AAJ5W3S4_9SPHI|nr:RNA polymerase sigma-70 factor [Pedobacter sp.]WEK17529.1 MAG: RNA polymerase sigma-70 factor [Pedobacter sp.]
MKGNTDFSELSDEELIGLMKAHNQIAFVCIYKRYWSELYRCAFKIFPNQETCEDLIHDVFLFLWNKRASVELKSLKDYLYIAVKNRTLNKIRSEKNLLKAISAQPVPVSSESLTEDEFNSKELDKVYNLALDGLPERCRTILLMSRKEHLSNKEIASKLNITPKTVENQITIGLRQLRIKLGDFLLCSGLLFTIFK